MGCVERGEPILVWLLCVAVFDVLRTRRDNLLLKAG